MKIAGILGLGRPRTQLPMHTANVSAGIESTDVGSGNFIRNLGLLVGGLLSLWLLNSAKAEKGLMLLFAALAAGAVLVLATGKSGKVKLFAGIVVIFSAGMFLMIAFG